MPLASGARLGPYEVLGLIGAGGMGEVYKARDTRLDRTVAIKVLPAHVSADPERRARFEREAKAVAALSHPNILAIHDTGTDGDRAYVVTELLEGETLRERLRTGALPVRKAIDTAMQVARGLAAAHEKGLVHRDLKPENVFLVRDGQVKILDFGLAKVMTPRNGAAETGVSLTDPGSVMGTVEYMAPEQVRGHAVDARTDLFALGAVLYEMLAARRPFQRDTAVETMTAILHEDPAEVSASQIAFPPALDRVVRRCLNKSPTERFQSARDLAFALETITWPALAVEGTSRDRSRSARLLLTRWGPPIFLTLLVGAALGRWTRGAPDTRAPSMLSTFRQVTDFPGIERNPTLAPDGKTVVYAGNASGNWDIYSLRVGGRIPVNLTAESSATDNAPVFSPSGDQIAFRSERAGGGIFVMGATGESVRRVTDAGYSPSWSPDGASLAVGSIAMITPFERVGTGELSIVTVATGVRRLLKVSTDAMQPAWSPHGQRIAYWGVHPGGQRDIWTVAADGSGEALPVTQDLAVDWNPIWSPDGRQLYFASDRGGAMNLWRIPIDEASGRALGPAEPISVPASFINGFSLATDGQVVFAAVARRSVLQRVDFDPVREAVVGDPVVLLQSPSTLRYVDWSPNGDSLVFGSLGNADNLYLIRADGSGYRQLTDDGFRNRGPKWFSDGMRIMFYTNRSGTYQMWSIRADGSQLRQLTNVGTGLLLPTPAPTDDRIAFMGSRSTRWRIADLGSGPVDHSEEMPPAPDGRVLTPISWSPDSGRIATFELAADQPHIFTYAFGTKEYKDLGVEGTDPRWLPDGRRLLFTSARNRSVTLIDTMSGRTREVLRLPSGLTTSNVAPNFGFTVSRNGHHIAFVTVEEDSDLWLRVPR